MKIPLKYRIFDTCVVLTSKDVERLSPHLVGWMRLANILFLGVNEPDLMRLITLELMGKQRAKFLTRLVGHLSRVYGRRINQRIQKVLKPSTTPGPTASQRLWYKIHGKETPCPTKKKSKPSTASRKNCG